MITNKKGGGSVPFWENQASLTVLQWALRAFVIFWWLLLLTKLMGQREMGRLNAFDFIVLITFGSVVAGVLNNPELSMQGAMVSVRTLAALNIVIAYLALKNARFRRIVQDEPWTGNGWQGNCNNRFSTALTRLAAMLDTRGRLFLSKKNEPYLQ